MGYERLWVLRGRFGCKFQFGSGLNLWGMGGYGLWEVCIMRVSTVIVFQRFNSVQLGYKAAV